MTADTGRLEYNQNTFIWAEVDADGIFTPPTRPDTTHLLARPLGFKSSMMRPIFEADVDISMGRIASFESIEAMLRNLKDQS